MQSKYVFPAAVAAIVVVLGVGIFFLREQVRTAPATSDATTTPGVPKTALETFAQCLASKKLTMHGASWCSHCANQKKLFGDAFKFVPYVECPDNVKLCLDKGVSGYPTWIEENGTKHEGEQSLEQLASYSGCPLPQ